MKQHPTVGPASFLLKTGLSDRRAVAPVRLGSADLPAAPQHPLARAVQGPWDALPQAPLPAIAHVQTADGLGHFVVLYRVKQQSVVVGDPGRDSIETWSREEFCGKWSGYLLLLTPERLLSPGSQQQQAGVWGRLLSLSRGHHWRPCSRQHGDVNARA